ncbi:MAG: hypothetical protein KAI66_20805 [Lentisphaeria bacterium]|nr:hypothetical protein [Lentisphaeria bacterium]
MTRPRAMPTIIFAAHGTIPTAWRMWISQARLWSQCLILGGKARAILHGRLNVSCEDIKALALPVMRHRLFTNFTADSEGVGPDDLVKQLLVSVPEPEADEYSE